MQAVEVLRKARALIEKPECWTKGVFARDAEGRELEPNNWAATCFCSLGALAHASGCAPGAVSLRVLRTLAAQIGDPTFPRTEVADFNDAPERTHAEVLAAFDKAIAAEGEST